MTEGEAHKFMERLAGTWPQTQVTVEMYSAWTDRLRRIESAQAMQVYDLLLNRGSAFTPSLAEFVATVAVAEQGPPPTPEQVDEVLRRNCSRWPRLKRGSEDSTRPDTPMSQQERTVAAIEQLQARGVHEAVCRFVGQVGARECGEMPDAAMGLVDESASVRRHELLKTYREQSVSSWKADPSRGLALERAVERVGLDPGRGARGIGEGVKALEALEA